MIELRWIKTKYHHENQVCPGFYLQYREMSEFAGLEMGWKDWQSIPIIKKEDENETPTTDRS